MVEMVCGYRTPLSQLLDPTKPFEVHLQTEGSAVYDACCFGTDADNKLSDDRYMVFYNQPRSPEGALVLSKSGQPTCFTVNLTQLPPQIVRLVFTVSIDGNETMNQIRSHTVSVVQDGIVCAQLRRTGADFRGERAVVDIEIYRKGDWRLCATVSGFHGGLGDLLRSFGGEEAMPAAPVNPQPQSAAINPVRELNTPKPAPQNPAPQQPTAPMLTGAAPVSLKKGEKVDLRKPGEPPLQKVVLGLGWDEAVQGASIDCDASAFLCIGGKLQSRRDIVCYTNLRHHSGAVIHAGDNLTGAGDGDDEQITVDLQHLPQQYDRIVFVVNIFMAKIVRQHFGMVRNCFIRICDSRGKELCRYNLSNEREFDGKTAMIFGELTRNGAVWSFHAIGQGTDDGSITSLSKRFK